MIIAYNGTIMKILTKYSDNDAMKNLWKIQQVEETLKNCVALIDNADIWSYAAKGDPRMPSRIRQWQEDDMCQVVQLMGTPPGKLQLALMNQLVQNYIKEHTVRTEKELEYLIKKDRFIGDIFIVDACMEDLGMLQNREVAKDFTVHMSGCHINRIMGYAKIASAHGCHIHELTYKADIGILAPSVRAGLKPKIGKISQNASVRMAEKACIESMKGNALVNVLTDPGNIPVINEQARVKEIRTTAGMQTKTPDHVKKCLYLSTRHLSKDTVRMLDEEVEKRDSMIEGIEIYAKEDYGWYIHMSKDQSPDEIPEDLMECLQLAMKRGCDMLCLDQAYEQDPGLLPIYDRD